MYGIYLLSFIRLRDNSNSQKQFIQPYLRQWYKYKTNKAVVYLTNKTMLAKNKLKYTTITRDFFNLLKNTLF